MWNNELGSISCTCIPTKINAPAILKSLNWETLFVQCLSLCVFPNRSVAYGMQAKRLKWLDLSLMHHCSGIPFLIFVLNECFWMEGRHTHTWRNTHCPCIGCLTSFVWNHLDPHWMKITSTNLVWVYLCLDQVFTILYEPINMDSIHH